MMMNLPKKSNYGIALLAVAAVTCFSSIAPAKLVHTVVDEPNALPVANDDLLTGLRPDSIVSSPAGCCLSFSNEQVSYMGGSAALTDGGFGVPGNPADGSSGPFTWGIFITGSHQSVEVTYTLNTDAGTEGENGWLISAINSFTSWRSGGSRVRQGYDVSFATVDDPDDFVQVFSIAPGMGGQDEDFRPVHATMVGTTDNAKVAIADLHVAKIRFHFNSGSGFGAAFREIDVTGVPVPEPATLAMMGMGSLLILRRRR